MSGLAADLRHAVRLYLKTPLSSALTLVVLAVAIACISAFVSLWNDLLSKPHLGFDHGQRLVTLGQTDGSRWVKLRLDLIDRIGEDADSVESVAGVMTATQYLVRDDEAEPIETELVTERFFTELGPAVALGRGLAGEDHVEGAEPVVVLSHDFWQRRFGGRPDVLGETIRVDGPKIRTESVAGRIDASEYSQTYRIVGIMASGMAGTFTDDTALWMAYEPWRRAIFGEKGSAGGLNAIARLVGDDVSSVRAELNGRYAGDESSLIGPDFRLDAVPGLVTDALVYRDTLRQVRLFLAGSLLLGLVATCTMSLFLLARWPSRQRELSIRVALGAPVTRLARQLLSEAVLLVLAAMTLGIFVGWWLTVLFQQLPFLQQAEWHSTSPFQSPVLSSIGGLAILLTLIASLAPITGLRRLRVSQHARTMTARAGFGQRLIGNTQVAMAGLLAGAAIAFGWYLIALANADRGFSAPDVQVVRLNGWEIGQIVDTDHEAVLNERERRREVIAALQGVQAVAFGGAVPGAGGFTQPALVRHSGDETKVQAVFVSADHAYPQVLGMRLVHGRLLGERDREHVLVNETLARRLWGRTDVVGQTLEIGGQGPGDRTGAVAGVLRDAAYGHPAAPIRPTVFSTVTNTSGADAVFVRSPLSSAELREMIEEAVDRGGLTLPIADVAPVDELWGRQLAGDRARTELSIASAILVVLLAALGFYGTQCYIVAAGRAEYAIRAALGADSKRLIRLVFSRALSMALPGLLAGSLLAFAAAAALRAEFLSSDVSAAAVTVFVAAGLVLLVVLASVGPARQVRRTAPVRLLREE
jgi:putative ABC transport system permease protein